MIRPVVGIVMGSKSDLPVLEETFKILDELNIPYEKNVYSAHRTPMETIEYTQSAKERGIKVLIAAAGGAAHLAGVIAGNTTLPVIGIPMQTSALGGMDSLLSTVQMPAGVPVATVAIGKAGAKNAAYLAASILALSDDDVAQKMEAHKAEMRRVVLEDMKL